MFYTYTEKMQNTFFGDWRTRAVALDTRRRYFYYSEPLSASALAVKSASSAASAAHPPTSPPLRGSPQQSQQGGASSSSSRSESASAALPSLSLPAPASPSAFTPTSASAPTVVPAEVDHVKLTRVGWNKKLKVLNVVPVATVQHMQLRDSHLAENDLYQLEITGEVRPMATGEIPPVGPLLRPSAGLIAMPLRLSLSNNEFIEDPFFLKELFNALRDQFEELELERTEREAETVAAGKQLPANRPLTISSPRPRKAAAADNVKKEKVLLRCRDEREFRRFWFVLQTVLGFDKLIVRPYRGLPPYDPRNMVSFSHIPMTVWHTFKALDKAVFYVFTRGDVMGVYNKQGSVSVNLHGCYLCVTHDMVYFMRDTGNIPRWIRLQEVSEFHYNTTAERPFFAFLSDPPVPDIVFVPLPPVFGPKAIEQYDPAFEVRRMQRVMHDTCFASLAIRRVVKLVESNDASVQAYVNRMKGSGRPLRLHPGASFNSAMSCPLPKEQLAAVWYEVQAELRARGDVATRMAIPLYETNANDLQLSEAQLSTIEQQLDDQRERLDDVVGMPLERARQLPTAHSPNSNGGSFPDRRTAHRRIATGRSVTGTRSCRRASGRAHADPASASLTAADVVQEEGAALAGADGSVVVEGGVRVLPLTAATLYTPQLVGTYQREAQRKARSTGSRASSSFCSFDPTEYSSYLVPGARYITRDELEMRRRGDGAGAMTTPELVAILVNNHEEEDRTPTRREGVASCPPFGGLPRAKNSSGFQYGPERTVNEIVSESMAALEKTKHE